jgi:uncharacterized membrane protein YfcA
MSHSPHRISGASEEFGTKHPGLALLVGGSEARMHAHVEMGKRHWLSTLFGGWAWAVAAAVAVVAGVAWLVKRLPPDWPVWAAGGAFVAVLAWWVWRRWRDPLRVPRF